MSGTNDARLLPELVPESLWGRSAHKMLNGKPAWKKIRGEALAAANHCCAVCRSSAGSMNCHDKWHYNDKQAVATLLGFESLCSNCHFVVHIGLAYKIGRGDIAFSHLCLVNQWSLEQAEASVEQATDDWIARSKRDWKIEVAPSLVQRYPELAGLPTFVPPPLRSGRG